MAMPSAAPPVATALKSVLVATDFSNASEKPIRHALAIARHFGAKFYLTHVVSSLGYTFAGPQAVVLASEAALRDIGHLEQSLVDQGALRGIEHEFLVREGIVWEQLQTLINEKRVDLVVVGTHARQKLGKFFLGSIAEQIFRHSRCLVLTVGPGALLDSPLDSRPFGPFLFATDFGEASLHALPRAISFANHFGVKLVLVHIEPITPVPEGFHWSRTSVDVGQLRESARREALQKLSKLVTSHEPLAVSPDFLVKFGHPAKTIQHVASEIGADLIVMGLNSTSHIDTASHVPWGHAYEVVCGATCPVLTVRS
jgi:nucleotide-binding universal stress UspA family protein